MVKSICCTVLEIMLQYLVVQNTASNDNITFKNVSIPHNYTTVTGFCGDKSIIWFSKEKYIHNAVIDLLHQIIQISTCLWLAKINVNFSAKPLTFNTDSGAQSAHTELDSIGLFLQSNPTYHTKHFYN